MSELELKGKKITTIICIVMVVITLLGLVASTLIGDFDITSIVKDIITLVLMYYIYVGKNWAKIIMTIWLAFGGVVGILGGLIGLAISPLLGIVTIILSIVCITIASILGANTSVKAYFNYCKSNN